MFATSPGRRVAHLRALHPPDRLALAVGVHGRSIAVPDRLATVAADVPLAFAAVSKHRHEPGAVRQLRLTLRQRPTAGFLSLQPAGLADLDFQPEPLFGREVRFHLTFPFPTHHGSKAWHFRPDLSRRKNAVRLILTPRRVLKSRIGSHGNSAALSPGFRSEGALGPSVRAFAAARRGTRVGRLATRKWSTNREPVPSR